MLVVVLGQEQCSRTEQDKGEEQKPEQDSPVPGDVIVFWYDITQATEDIMKLEAVKQATGSATCAMCKALLRLKRGPCDQRP